MSKNLFKNYKLAAICFFSLRFHLSFKPRFICPSIYYYLLGEREKYVLFNISVLVENLLKLKKFIKYSLASHNKFCFISFNPLYSNLAKQLALESKQNYITGSWFSGFFSRGLPSSFSNKLFKNDSLGFNFLRSSMPIFIFITLDNSENFLCEIRNFNLPVITISGLDQKLVGFSSYSIICETFSLESVFFYSKLLLNFLKINAKS